MWSRRLRRSVVSLAAAPLLLTGLAASDLAAAQDPAPEYAAYVSYYGDLPLTKFSKQPDINLAARCRRVDPVANFPVCNPEGTLTISVSAASAKQLGISSRIVGKGVLGPCGGGRSCLRDFSVPPAVLPRLERYFKSAQRKCGGVCVHDVAVPGGRFSATLTGPAGMPGETISGTVEKLVLNNRGIHYTTICTSNAPGTKCDINEPTAAELEGRPQR